MLTVKINDAPVKVLVASANVDDTIDQRATAQFTVVDESGMNHVQPGLPVVITDTFAITPLNPDGLVFSGYVDNVDESNLPPNPTIKSTCQCAGQHYLADKRYYNGPEFTSVYAGDIATEFISSVLSQEGVTASFARDHTSTVAEWSAGTLSTTVASTDNNGSLELAPAGDPVRVTFTTSNVSAEGGAQIAQNTIVNNSMSAIQYIASCTMPGTNAYMYTKIWGGSYAIQAGDKFNYDIWISKASPKIMAAIDFICSDGTTFRDTALIDAGMHDQQSMSPHPGTDLTGLADNQWYHRNFPIGYSPALIGKTIVSISVAFEGDTTGTYTAYFRRIYINNRNTGNNTLIIFTDTSTVLPTIPQNIGVNGYTDMQCKVVTAYDSFGYVLTGIVDMSPVGIYQNSLIHWDTTLPDGCVLEVAATTTQDASGNAAVFFDCTNNAALPGLIVGQSLSDLGMYCYFFLYNKSNDPIYSPIWRSCTVQITPAYQTAKNDYRYKAKVTGEYDKGILHNLIDSNNLLQISGFQAKFDFSTPSATLYGSATPAVGLANRTLALSTGASSDVRYRIDAAGNTWNDGVVEVDLKVDTGVQLGVVYRTTDSAWSNTNNSYGYVAGVSLTQLFLGYGSNSSSGSIYAQLSSVTLNLTAGNWHHLKVVFSGTSHQVFLDDVPYISYTDATYTNAGYVALRSFNAATTGSITGYFRNFGVAVALSGTWISPTLNISSVGVVGAAFVRSQIAGDVSQTAISLEISYDGGSTWKTCPSAVPSPQNNNVYDCEAVPGLSPGTSTTPLTQVQLRVTLAISSAGAHLEAQGVVLYILSSYQAIGQRFSHPLSLSTVGRIGSASVSWNGHAPTGTTIEVETLVSGGNWTPVGTGASGGAAIPGLNGQSQPIIDLFQEDSSDTYTNTYAPAGSAAHWTYEDSRLVVTGGQSALYLYEEQRINDGYVLMDTDMSDGGGLVLHYTNDHFYYLQVNDNHTSVNSNTITLYKYTSSSTQLASASIQFARGVPHRFLLRYVQGAIIASMDGEEVIRYSDTNPIPSGMVGLWSAGHSSTFYQLFIQPFGDAVGDQTLSTRVTLMTTDPTVSPYLLDMTLSVRSPNIMDGALMPSTKYSILNGSNTIAKSLDDLGKQSDAVWWIGSDRQFYFQVRNAQPAPWIATWEDILISGNKISNVQDGYRNDEWITGGFDHITFSETKIGDGKSTTWNVGYPIHSIQNMSLNGYTASFGVKGSTGKQFYYEANSTSITADKSISLLTDLDELHITYTGQVPITVNIRRESEVDARSKLDGTSGIVSLIEDGTGLDKYACIQLANGHLDQYARVGKTIEFTTLRPGLAPAMILPVFLPAYGLKSAVFLITDMSTTWRPVQDENGDLLHLPFFTVKGTQGAVIGDWTRLITQLHI